MLLAADYRGPAINQTETENWRPVRACVRAWGPTGASPTSIKRATDDNIGCWRSLWAPPETAAAPFSFPFQFHPDGPQLERPGQVNSSMNAVRSELRSPHLPVMGALDVRRIKSWAK